MRRSTPRLTVARALVLDLLALELADGLLEQLHVQVEADRLDVPALLAAEQVAGAADLEVERGDAEAAAEVAELAGSPPAASARSGDSDVLGRNQQVGVRAAVGAAHAAAQLVELRQPVPVGAVDDDRVHVRDVEPVLDDRRRDAARRTCARRSRPSRARARPRPSARAPTPTRASGTSRASRLPIE